MIIVTGGSGLVGTALKRLHPEWKYINSKDYDLTDPYECMKCFEVYKPSIVIHLASVVLGGHTSEIQQFDSFIKNNMIHTNIFNCCKEYKVKHIITCLTTAISENLNVTIKDIEDGPLLDCSHHYGYIHSKRLLHSLSVSYERAKLGICTLLCPVNIYGNDDIFTSNRFIPSIYQKLLNGQTTFDIPSDSLRQLIYNDDVAKIISKFIDSKVSSLYIIGNPSKLQTRDIITQIGKKLKIDVNFTDKGTCISRTAEISKLPFDFEYSKFEDTLPNILNIEKHTQEEHNITLGNFQSSIDIKKNIFDVLKSGRLTYGKYCIEMEQRFAKLHECKFAILTNSGTSSLQVGIAAMKEYYGWNDDDEVLVPAVTFVASINTIISNNLKPVLVDVNPVYYNIEPNEIEKHISKKTKAIMVVHLFGQPCDMRPIMNICEKYNIKIIEDSCETMIAKYNNNVVGSFGDFGAFSTYVAHIMVTGVGGILTTNNEKLAIIARSLVNHGRNNIYIQINDDDDTENEMFKEIIEKRFQFERIGYSYRITELEAAIGVCQLDSIYKNIELRQRNAHILTNLLSEFDEYLQLPSILPNTDHVFMMYPIVLKTNNKKDLIYFLEKNNIETRDLMPIINQPVYKNWIDENNYPNAQYLNTHGFYIGCHPDLDESDMKYIYKIFKKYFE